MLWCTGVSLCYGVCCAVVLAHVMVSDCVKGVSVYVLKCYLRYGVTCVMVLAMFMPVLWCLTVLWCKPMMDGGVGYTA